MKSNSVVFIAELPWERPAKIAAALRAKGVSVLLIYLIEPNNFDPREYFTHTFKADTAQDAVNIARRLRPSFVHHFSYGADQTAYYLFSKRFCKVIYDYKDCFENLIYPPNNDFWHEIQRMCIERADGLVCRDLQLWNYCKVNKVSPKAKRLLFLDYCWGQNIYLPAVRDDEEVHVVLAGNFTIERITPSNTDSGYIHTSRALVSRGVHVHLYPRWHFEYVTQDDQMRDYLELAAQSPYFHLHKPVAMAEFTKELSQYDFGLGIFQGALFEDIGIHSHKNGCERHGMASRWFDYIEAGLDILASPELKFMYRTMRNASVTVPATSELFLLRDIKSVLIEKRNENKTQRIDAAQKKFDINQHITKLIDFYNSV